MSGAALWIMDEPFTNLDPAGREFLEDEMTHHLERGGLAVVAAHHELNLPPEQLARIELGEVNG
jgi:heme exporter protein A